MIIVSGLSGAGKTVALHTLEDMGYYCIDNLPINLLPTLFEEQKAIEQTIAVGIDVRSANKSCINIANVIEEQKSKDFEIQTLFLTASNESLIKRFSESRRKHPLSGNSLALVDAITLEKSTLSNIQAISNFNIDTSQTSIYELKDRIKSWLNATDSSDIMITIESFGFKHGVPIDADIMFDVRFLPNPHWETNLRQYSGKNQQIKDYLGAFTECEEYICDTTDYLCRWIPVFFKSHRTYLTIAIGCTGGRHRSVYTVETIAERLQTKFNSVTVVHRDL